MVNFSDVSTRDLVLLALLKLSGRGSGLCVEATIKNIKKVLKQDYDRPVTRTRVEQLLQDLESQHFIYGEKGLLSDRRVHIYRINPYKIDQELFTIIKNSEKAVVYGDKYAGTIYDTQSLYKIEHDLPDELDEFYDELPELPKLPTIKTISASNNGWFPDQLDAALIEDLLTKINTYLEHGL